MWDPHPSFRPRPPHRGAFHRFPETAAAPLGPRVQPCGSLVKRWVHPQNWKISRRRLSTVHKTAPRRFVLTWPQKKNTTWRHGVPLRQSKSPDLRPHIILPFPAEVFTVGVCINSVIFEMDFWSLEIPCFTAVRLEGAIYVSPLFFSFDVELQRCFWLTNLTSQLARQWQETNCHLHNFHWIRGRFKAAGKTTVGWFLKLWGSECRWIVYHMLLSALCKRWTWQALHRNKASGAICSSAGRKCLDLSLHLWLSETT